MIINIIGDTLVVSTRTEEFSIRNSEKNLKAIQEIQTKFGKVKTKKEMEVILDKLRKLTTLDIEEKISDFHPLIAYNALKDKFYLKVEGIFIEIPQTLGKRIKLSVEKGISVDPIIKLYTNFLRNPKMINGTQEQRNLFAERFSQYIDLIYVRKDVLNEKLKEGLSLQVATELSSTYEVKITMEGLLACYKISTEVDHKFILDENGNPKKVDRYTKKFDENTGEITGDSRNDLNAEDRLFIPAVMGYGGDAFLCEGPTGFDKPGHFIKIGCVHSLDSWEKVNTDDNMVCVKGLHVGGLSYISGWEGEIHTCLVHPMNIGAICRYNDSLALRTKEYFIDGSLTSLNHSIYHSSDYAQKAEEDWKKDLQKIKEVYAVRKNELSETIAVLDSI